MDGSCQKPIRGAGIDVREMAEEIGKIPMSPGLQATLIRAREYASGQSHAQVTLEHLLLALTEDDDAAGVMQSSNVDLARLRNDVATYLGGLEERSPPGAPAAPNISTPLTEILKYATLAARQGRRSRIDGAIVLAALVGHGQSMAASFLNAQGLTFQTAIQVLQRAQISPTGSLSGRPPGTTSQMAGSNPVSAASPLFQSDVLRQSALHSPPASTADPASAEAILAAARERIVSRTTQLPRIDTQDYSTSEGLFPTTPDLTAAPFEDEPQSADFDAAHVEGGPGFTHPERPMPVAARSSDAAARANALHQINLSSPYRASEAPQPAHHPASPAQIADSARSPQAAQVPAPTTKMPEQRLQVPGWVPPPLPTPQSQQGVSRPRPLAPPVTNPRRMPAQTHGEWEQRYEPPAAPPWAERPLSINDQISGRPAASLQQGHVPEPAMGTLQPPYAAAAPKSPRPLMGQPADPRAPAIDASLITHSVPARLQKGRPVQIEVRVGRNPMAGLASGPRPQATNSDYVAARAISVRLRSTKPGVSVEAVSPETQWDQGLGPSGRLTSDAAVWRFNLTPHAAGKRDLQLMVSARTIGADGVIADASVPDRTISVTSVVDWTDRIRRSAQLVLIILCSVFLAKLAETLLRFDLGDIVKRLLGS